jgi:16S rRNA A1518/A1519 N6-dimethyltransferase RsmA/KsgA/DIM1 with predicted DNA glycosylase/AP lyase activity
MACLSVTKGEGTHTRVLCASCDKGVAFNRHERACGCMQRQVPTCTHIKIIHPDVCLVNKVDRCADLNALFPFAVSPLRITCRRHQESEESQSVRACATVFG